MSDYLWDKSGEPDADVERLEELFKDLRYQPLELELPLTPGLSAIAPRRKNYWTGLAAAAALVLMGLAGLWLNQHRGGGRTISQSSAVAQATQETERQPDMSAIENPSAAAPGPAREDERQADPAVEGPRRQILPRQAPRRKQELVGPNMVGPHGVTRVSTDRQEVADAGRQRRFEQQKQQAEGIRAREELMLALQVASAKLNHAQRKARGGTSIPGPDSKPAAPANIPWNKSR
jgi:hypothetical protein